MLRQEQAEIKASMALTNKRLDDVNTHLVDQSRRIDGVREGLNSLIDAGREELASRIDETNKRLDAVYGKLDGRLDMVRGELIGRIDDINKRLDRLYEVIVRREEHEKLAVRMDRLEQEMEELKKRVAA